MGLIVLRFQVLDFSDDTLSVQDLSENDMLAVKMRCRNSCDKELGAVGAFQA